MTDYVRVGVREFQVVDAQHLQLIELNKATEAQTRALEELQKDLKILNEEVGEEDVAQVVSKWTRIPVE